jgi:murein DD-endopeptidase MepM/ murein hydrolase activator NlpD
MNKPLLASALLLVGAAGWMAGRASRRNGLDAKPFPQIPAPRMPAFPPMSAAGVVSLSTPAPPAPALDEAPLPQTTTAGPPATQSEPLAGGTDNAATITTTQLAPDLTPASEPAIRSAVVPHPLIVPVAGVPRSAMRDMFNESRGNRRHEAIDILAPRGTPVIAAADGVVKKLFTSVPGGLTVYQFDPEENYCYYYAHLDAYAPGLKEGQRLRSGDAIGFVGTTGNAPKDTPHLHFALIRLDPDKRWWKGTYVDPYPLLSGVTPR